MRLKFTLLAFSTIFLNSSTGRGQMIASLTQTNKLEQVYLATIIVFVTLLLVIILLISRNLKRTKKNHKEATLQNKQLQHTLAELERVNKNYIRVMRVMAHDLRNPLSGMTGIAAMLMDDDDFSEDNRYMLKLIETTGIHSMEMINELLKSGLADENEKVVMQKIDLKSLLYDSVELLRFKANDKQQQILFESDEVPVMAAVNHEKIWRVINNLIVNAIKLINIF
jgi:signal transduction histidine kinase